ncbi:hypothetical protein GALL_486130 [mine drainage metagenome]|uniref:Uncharacterized protein n=1 Tax=mine drainage metagenome TaxID=410659 RepID=A0A1J5Q1N8_9ZZZZ
MPPGAAQHHGAHRGVFRQRLEHARQPLDLRFVEGVVDFRPVEGDEGQAGRIDANLKLLGIHGHLLRHHACASPLRRRAISGSTAGAFSRGRSASSARKGSTSRRLAWQRRVSSW